MNDDCATCESIKAMIAGLTDLSDDGRPRLSARLYWSGHCISEHIQHKIRIYKIPLFYRVLLMVPFIRYWLTEPICKHTAKPINRVAIVSVDGPSSHGDFVIDIANPDSIDGLLGYLKSL